MTHHVLRVPPESRLARPSYSASSSVSYTGAVSAAISISPPARWSDVEFAIPEPGGVVESQEQKRTELLECVEYFARLWEEILKRFEKIEVQAEPERTFSSFVKGYTYLPVKLTRKRA